MRRRFYVVLCVFAGSACFCLAATPLSSLKPWESILSSKGTNLVFDEYAKTSPPWPKAPRLSAGQGATIEIEQVRRLASATICDTRKLVREATSSPAAKKWTRIEAAIRLRDSVLQVGQYNDLVLADALTRGIAVALCKQLGDDAVGADLKQSLAHLKAYQVPLEKWISVAGDEFGVRKELLDIVRGSSNEEDRVDSLWRLLSDGDDSRTPHNVQAARSLDLLKSPNLALLFHRHIQTDVLLKTLSLAVEYKSRVEGFSLNDSEDKIATIIPGPIPTAVYVLTKDGVFEERPVALDPAKYSMGERFLRLQVSYAEVARLLRAIKSNDIEKHLFFDVTDVISPK